MHTLILMTALQFATADSAQAGDHAPVSPQSPARQEDRATRNPDMVLRWNDIFLEVIRKERTPPPVAARNLAIVHVSIYDAVNAIAGVHARYLVDIKPLAGASPQAAAATAHLTLTCSTTIAGMAYSHPPLTVPVRLKPDTTNAPQ